MQTSLFPVGETEDIYWLILLRFYQLIALSSMRFIFFMLGILYSSFKVSFKFLAIMLRRVILFPQSSISLRRPITLLNYWAFMRPL